MDGKHRLADISIKNRSTRFTAISHKMTRMGLCVDASALRNADKTSHPLNYSPEEIDKITPS